MIYSLRRCTIAAAVFLIFAAATQAQNAQGSVLRWTFNGAVGDQFGMDVTYLRDLDGDGSPEIAISANVDDGLANPPYPGYVKVFSGGTGTLLYTLSGEHIFDFFGCEIDNAKDIDGDGFDDLIVGARKFIAGTPAHAGKVYIYSGLTGTLIRSHLGAVTNDDFGYSCAGIGDVNGDGTNDYAIGARLNDDGAPDAGKIYVYSGATGTLIRSHNGLAFHDHLGNGVCGLGDVNGDGVPDYIAGATENAVGGFKAGAAYLWSGATGALLHTFVGTGYPGLNGAEFGAEFAPIGDLNGDGMNEFIICSEEYDVTQTTPDDTGRVYIISSGTFATLATITGEAPGTQFGESAGGGGDVNGDGVPDFVVGGDQIDLNGAVDAGRAYVYSGATFQLLYTISGAGTQWHLGHAVKCDGDIDGDGKADVICSAYLDNTLGTLSGRVFVYTGIGNQSPVLTGAPANGNNTNGSGQAEANLFLNGSTGGTAHRVDLRAGRILNYQITQPSANALPANQITWIWLGVPATQYATVLPAGIGTMAFIPTELNPGAPVADFTSSFPNPTIAPFLPSTTTPFLYAIQTPVFPISVTFQGVIERQPGQYRVTDAVIAHMY